MVNLYAQKGHNLHACRRFLRKRPAFSTARSVRRLRRVVCVSHPGSKGFHLFYCSTTTQIFYPRQGAQAHRGYLCQRSCSTMGDAEIDHLRVPATNSCSSCTNPPCLIPWWFMILPTNLSTFSRAELYRGSPPHTCRNFVQPYRSADLCAFPFPHLTSHRGN